MKIEQTILKKIFKVRMGKKIYYANYLSSDSQTPELFNRLSWEIHDEDGEEVNVLYFKRTDKKEIRQIKYNLKLVEKIISFCTKHFNDFVPPGLQK